MKYKHVFFGHIFCLFVKLVKYQLLARVWRNANCTRKKRFCWNLKF